MSQIAHALAKAKERTGQTTAPFLGTGGAPAPDPAREAALRRAKAGQRFWLILGLVALPLTGFIFWTQLRESAPAVPAASATHSATPAETWPSDNPRQTSSATTASIPPANSAANPTPAATTSSPRPELMQTVNALAISAVMPGDPARIMLAGKIVRAGEAVGDGLVFSGVADGQLRFTDTRGVVYARYY